MLARHRTDLSPCMDVVMGYNHFRFIMAHSDAEATNLLATSTLLPDEQADVDMTKLNPTDDMWLCVINANYKELFYWMSSCV